MITFAEATPELAMEYYGAQPAVSFRGYVALLDGRPVGVGGVSFVNGMRVAFSEMKDDMRPMVKARARAVRLLERLLDTYKTPVFAVANPDEPTSAGLLQRLRFEPVGVEGERGPVLVRHPCPSS